MKKVLCLIAVLLLTGCTSNVCDITKGDICVDEETGQYLIEENASVSVAFENQEIADGIIALWNKTYPEYKDVIIPVIYDDYTVDSFQNMPTDIALLDLHHAVVLKSQLANFDETLMQRIEDHLPGNMIVDANEDFFLPLMAYGTAFATNLSVIDEEISPVDINNDNLIDELDTYEKINYAGYKVPVVLDDSMFGYPYYSFGYQFFNDTSVNPFESETFIETLNNISAFSKKFPLTDWKFEMFLDQTSMAFSQIGPWMYYNQEEDPILISKMPTFNGVQLSPLVYPTGYVLSSTVENKNLAHMVLELIYSQKGLQTIIDNSNNIIVYNFELANREYQEDEEVIEPYKLKYKTPYDEMFAKAYQFSTIEDFKALEADTTVRYYDSLYDITYVSVITDLYNGDITVEQAQQTLIEYYNEWFNSYIIDEE